MAEHVMADIETLSVSNNAHILEIAAVKFTEEGMTGESFIRRIKPSSQPGRDISPATLQWWMVQDGGRSQYFAKMLSDRNAVTLDAALGDLCVFVADAEGVWGNGAAFDNAILRSAIESFPSYANLLWSHRVDRCYRTLVAMFPDIDRPFMDPELAHQAIYDAGIQATHAAYLLRLLRDRQKKGRYHAGNHVT